MNIQQLSFSFLETCARCNDPFKNQITKLYLEFLNTQLIPELSRKNVEYAEWWILKPESSLSNLIQQQRLPLNLFFRPIELTTLIQDYAHQNDMYIKGNENILILNDELKTCFNTPIVYIPDLYNLCLPHVDVVNESKSFVIKNKLIHDEMYVDSPTEIIYCDPSSKFWIPRQFFSSGISTNNQFIFSWKELYDNFLSFITKPNAHIKQITNTIFFIDDNSIFADRFNFKYFHINQISLILKQMIKFLGKSNTILTACPDLKFEDINPQDDVVLWMEDIIQNNNNITPYVSSFIYL
jgi:hypothetical protein